MIIELPIAIIDHESGEPREVVAVINTATRETSHVPVGQGASTILIEENPDD